MKANYELTEDDYLNTSDEDYYKEMDLHSGEILAYGKLLEMIIYDN